MIAYFVHNSETETDTIYLPEKKSIYPVNRARILTFITAEPDFSSWSNGIVVPPEEFGGVIALRDGNGEVSVLNPELWQQRLTTFI